MRAKHGHTKSGGWMSPEYASWRAARTRCRNPNIRKWAIYGGAGITFSTRWDDFEVFLKDMGPKPTPRHTLERVDSKGNYEPGNCIWATYEKQNRNRSVNRFITINGETRCIAEWAKIVGITRVGMGQRVNRGLTGDALLAKSRRAPRYRRSDDERRAGLGLR